MELFLIVVAATYATTTICFAGFAIQIEHAVKTVLRREFMVSAEDPESPGVWSRLHNYSSGTVYTLLFGWFLGALLLDKGTRVRAMQTFVREIISNRRNRVTLTEEVALLKLIDRYEREP